jgi:hypothetical protein
LATGRADYAFAVYEGIVRAVYRIDPDKWVIWKHPPREPVDKRITGRRAFAGERDLQMEKCYVWRDVSRNLVRGAQNPIKVRQLLASALVRDRGVVDRKP